MMLRRLASLDQDELSLKRVVLDLQALKNCLEDTDEQWLRGFQRQWAVLEEVCACEISPAVQVQIDRAARELEVMLLTILAATDPESDRVT